MCTDADDCCAPEDLVCIGDVDGNTVCSCRKLWDCDKNQNKCSQPVVPPDGTGGWECNHWGEFEGLVCKKSGTDQPFVPGFKPGPPLESDVICSGPRKWMGQPGEEREIRPFGSTTNKSCEIFP